MESLIARAKKISSECQQLQPIEKSTCYRDAADILPELIDLVENQEAAIEGIQQSFKRTFGKR